MNSLIKETLFRISDIMCILKYLRLKGPEVCIFPCFCLVASVVSDSLQPHGLQPARFLVHGIIPGKYTGADCHFLLQGLFLTQGLNTGLLYWQAGSLQSLNHQGSPFYHDMCLKDKMG